MTETFLSKLLLMFKSSRYFVHNARRDTESDTELRHVPVQRFKKKRGRKK